MMSSGGMTKIRGILVMLTSTRPLTPPLVSSKAFSSNSGGVCGCLSCCCGCILNRIISLICKSSSCSRSSFGSCLSHALHVRHVTGPCLLVVATTKYTIVVVFVVGVVDAHPPLVLLFLLVRIEVEIHLYKVPSGVLLKN